MSARGTPVLAALSVLGLGITVLWGCESTPPPPACDPDNGGITLPDGFCALVVADSVGRVRHITVAANGDIFAAMRRDRPATGIVALRDTSGDGRADLITRFGERGGTGISLYAGYLYFAADDRVLRYPYREGRLRPREAAETVVSGLPGVGSLHHAKTAVIDPAGNLFVNIGSPSYSCEEGEERVSAGIDPCPELENRAGIWRFDAGRLNQTQADGTRFATGLRNTFALAVHPVTGDLWGAQHGRGSLTSAWGGFYTDEDDLQKPAEEFVRIIEGDDFGWPYCYHDPVRGKKLLAPEYGGDGLEVGRCAEFKDPEIAFPAHFAPMAIAFYTGELFPHRYRGGAFIAFHGSRRRATLPESGHTVVFVPFADGRPTGEWEIFADGFEGEDRNPGEHRPSGVTMGPDGSLYVTDDRGGRIYRIVYLGE